MQQFVRALTAGAVVLVWRLILRFQRRIALIREAVDDDLQRDDGLPVI